MSDHAQPSDARWSELLTADYSAATTTLCLGVALFAFNGFLVSTSLPTAVGEIGGIELISWAFTLYLVFSIVGGASGEHAVRRWSALDLLGRSPLGARCGRAPFMRGSWVREARSNPGPAGRRCP